MLSNETAACENSRQPLLPTEAIELCTQT